MIQTKIRLKACTHMPTLGGSVFESEPESADYTADSVIVGQLPLSNMFNILNPLESADGNRPTIAVGRREISPVVMGL